MTYSSNINITADAVLFLVEDDAVFVLLIQRGNSPYKGQWALPGGFIEQDELVVDGCKRELKEETNIDIDKMTFINFYDAIARDPRSRTITFAYFAKTTIRHQPIASDDASKAEWFSLENLPKLAFDHDDIIADAIQLYSNSK